MRFASLGSTLALFEGGPVSGQSSLSHRENVLMTAASNLFEVLHLLIMVLKGKSMTVHGGSGNKVWDALGSG